MHMHMAEDYQNFHFSTAAIKGTKDLIRKNRQGIITNRRIISIKIN